MYFSRCFSLVPFSANLVSSVTSKTLDIAVCRPQVICLTRLYPRSPRYSHPQAALFIQGHADYRQACFNSLVPICRQSLRENVRKHWSTFWAKVHASPWPSFDESLRLYKAGKNAEGFEKRPLPCFKMWDLWIPERLAEYRASYWLPDA